MGFIDEIKAKVKEFYPSIVFPEGSDSRILRAASRLNNEKILTPILLGEKSEIEDTAIKENISIDNLICIDPKEYYDLDNLAEIFVQRRNGKISFEDAKKTLIQPNYFGTLLVQDKRVDGMVSGAVYTTADTVRPVLQIIKTREGIKKTSGLFILIREDQTYIMSDCAINTELDSQTLSEIAYLTNNSAKQFGIDPKIAMLSFSTKGSAKSDEVDIVREATEIIKNKYPEIDLDGELQFDAAIDPVVANKKAPDSKVAGHANAFIFPNLAAGNIGYKIAQRLGKFEAIGPILQGLNYPVNDLSRGCNEDEVYSLAIITAAQAVL